MSSINVVNAIGVKLTPPEEGQKEWSHQVGDLWPPQEKEVIAFAAQVDAKFHRSSKTYGAFKIPFSENSFPGRLSSHLDGKVTFLAFIQGFIEKRLINEARKSRNSKGAVLVFLHYEFKNIDSENKDADFERFLILMLKNTDALRFKKNLQLNPVDIIDLDKFLQGARVDLFRFKDSNNEVSETDNLKNNLCFIKGIGEVRQYFITAIGANDIISNATSSEQCIKAIGDFNKNCDFGRTIKEKIEVRIQTLFDKSKRGESISLERIQNEIDAVIPVEYVKYKGTFIDFVNENNYEVNQDFEVMLRDKKDFQWLEIETEIARLSVNRHQIGLPDSGRPITFDEKTSTVTIAQKISDPVLIEKLKEASSE
ncbi:nucleoid-associated protein [Yersinia enterocolitica]